MVSFVFWFVGKGFIVLGVREVCLVVVCMFWCFTFRYYVWLGIVGSFRLF